MPSVFILGPSLESVFEPVAVEPDAAVVAGRRQIAFDVPPTSPGGQVHLAVLPPLHPDDILPLNIYAFFYQPIENVPASSERTPDWFFKSGAPSGSLHVGAADEDGKFTVVVKGVKPSLQPYFVQTVLEFTK